MNNINNMNNMGNINNMGNMNNMNMNAMMLNPMNNIQNFNNNMNMNFMGMNNLNNNMYGMMQNFMNNINNINNINNMNMNMMQNNFQMNSMSNFTPQSMPMQSMNNFGVININMPMNNNNLMNPNTNNDPNLQKLNNNIVNIFQCFEYNQKIDKFAGQDQIYCNKCNSMAEATYSSTLETAPKVLILLLNRGTGIQFKIKLEFTEFLDIGKYVNRKIGNNVNYQLIGVITHLGESGQSGHFIAHCKSPIDHQWYTYNDALVSKIDDYQKQVIDLGMPYLLFYRRIEEQNVNNNIQK
jgi:hypothetical protein